MEILIDDPDLKIMFEPGSSDAAVISFTGIGHNLGAIQLPEFGETLRSAAPDCHVYYVIDKNRAWYNGIELRIASILGSHLRNSGARAVYTVGNSMGGFGAILFAGLLPNVRSAIAFSPQSSVHPIYVPSEVRWQHYVQRISSWTVPDVLPLMSRDVRYLVFFGAEHAMDARHAERFTRLGPPSATLWKIEGDSHGVAAKLKRRGLIVDVLRAAMSPSDHALDAVDTVLSRGICFRRNSCGGEPADVHRAAGADGAGLRAGTRPGRPDALGASDAASTLDRIARALSAALGLGRGATSRAVEAPAPASRAAQGTEADDWALLSRDERRARRRSRLAALPEHERAEAEDQIAQREQSRRAARKADRVAARRQ
ncbi:MAG TPA: hypothetical protein VHL98_20655 [Microvirga sp.]|jgi:hypothetical protein|nr:hypothetical protein [Microvirga sp.]